MKKMAIVASLLALGACTGARGIEGGQKTCTHMTLFGISLEQMVSPCTK
jgi:hypothetical protein